MLEISGIDTFYGKAHILRGVSFAVGTGEVVALLGRNGAGKTTTLKTVMQLLHAARGTVHFNGANITGWAPHRVARAGLCYVPEDRRIFASLTVAENLEVGRQPARDDAPKWTPDALYELFPNLAERRDNLGGALSGGEQQMLTIARSLMGNPRLLLLDEPSEGIAPVIVQQMTKTIREMKAQGLTVLLSEQNLRFARQLADRAVVLEGGTVRFDGTFEALEANPEVRDAYLAV